MRGRRGNRSFVPPEAAALFIVISNGLLEEGRG